MVRLWQEVADYKLEERVTSCFQGLGRTGFEGGVIRERATKTEHAGEVTTSWTIHFNDLSSKLLVRYDS